MPRRLAIRYALFLADGTEVENNHWEAPLVYTEGSGELLPGLAAAIHGLPVGQTQRVELAADQAFGPRLPDAMQRVSLFSLPAESRYVGALLSVGDDHGCYQTARVHCIDGAHAELDLNHPLAGETLVFEVTIIEEAHAYQATDLSARSR